jgi:rhodanese-related sulfurtransferase
MKKSFITTAIGIASIFGGISTAAAWEYIHADDAYHMLQNEDTYILDIRTPAEWYYVGHPDMEGKVFNISYWLWELNPRTKEYEYIRTPKFFDEAVVRRFKDGDTIIVMCKSDGRASRASTELEDPTTPAAQRLEELGSYTVYNMGGGFESPEKVHDGTTYIGWKPSGLPYVISSAGAWKPIFDERGRSLIGE